MNTTKPLPLPRPTATAATAAGEAAKSITRISIIVATALIGLVCLMAEPADSNPNWMMLLLMSKAVAAACIYAAWHLYEHWRKTDKWLAAYDKSCREAIDTADSAWMGKEEEQ